VSLALSEVNTTSEGLQVVLSGTQPFSYRLVNHDQPLHLTIDVPQARIERPEVRTVGYGGINTLRLSQVSGAEPLVRLDVDLADDAVYSLAKGQAQLDLRVRTAAPQEPLRTVASKATDSEQPTVLPQAVSRAPRAKEYKVGTGDTLAITVYDEPDLTLQRRVTERGLIDFPLIGQVQVVGLTAMQVAERLESQLSPGYLRHPQVFVDIAEFASKKVFIVGAVAKPMAFTLRGETSLLEVLSQTDSLSQSGSLTVFRRISTPGEQGVNHNDVQAIYVDLQALLQQGNMSKNLLLQAQDVVYIPKPDAVFVFGEVAKTGPIPLPEGGMSLVETINKAGGFSKFAASKRTRVLRMVEGQETIIYVDMAAIIRGDLGKDIRLRSNDIVIVPEAVF
jgi:polysaccharide export outer membrane protein